MYLKNGQNDKNKAKTDCILTAFWLNSTEFDTILTAFGLEFDYILAAFWLHFDWILTESWLNIDWKID